MFSTVFYQIGDIWTSLCAFSASKFIASGAFVAFAFLFGCALKPVIIGLVTLMIIDLVTGIGSSFARGEAIESRRMLKSSTKLVVYGLFLSAGHITSSIVPEAGFLDTAVASFLALTEFVSIIENIGLMGFAIPQKLLNQLSVLRGKDGVDGNEGARGVQGVKGNRGTQGTRGRQGTQGVRGRRGIKGKN